MTNTLYGFNAMEVQEAFVKIREQVCSQHAPTGAPKSALALSLQIAGLRNGGLHLVVCMLM